MICERKYFFNFLHAVNMDLNKYIFSTVPYFAQAQYWIWYIVPYFTGCFQYCPLLGVP